MNRFLLFATACVLTGLSVCVAFPLTSPLPVNNNCAYNLVGNMEGTTGCTAINHRLYITIECDGKYQSSLEKMLKKYNEYGCRKPLNIRLEKPNFALTPELFSSVTQHIYRLEIFGIRANSNLTRAFLGLNSLKILTLQLLDATRNENGNENFSQKTAISSQKNENFSSKNQNFSKIFFSSKNQTFHLSSEIFAGIENLQFFRFYASSVPVRIERGAFEPLGQLRCLYFTGENVGCDRGYDDFIAWRHRRKNSMLKKFRDFFSHRNENCAAPAQCRSFSQQTISKKNSS